MSDKNIKIETSSLFGCAFEILAILLCCIVFWGEPDLLDLSIERIQIENAILREAGE